MLAHSISVLRLGKALSVAQPLCGIQNCTNDDMTVMKSLGFSIVELCSMYLSSAPVLSRLR